LADKPQDHIRQLDTQDDIVDVTHLIILRYRFEGGSIGGSSGNS
jgi:hypothetical protein